MCECVGFGCEKIEKRKRRERVIRDLRGREMKDLRCREFSLWVRDKREAKSLRNERKCVR